MSFEQDVYRRSHEKLAGLMDSLGGLIGNNGSLSTPLTALGGAALGGMAGKSLGIGNWGVGLGALLGGTLGGVGANAINSQNMYQNMNDAALINGISAGLNANDQTDMMQNQAIAQTNDTVNQLVGIVGDMMQNNMGMMGGMPPMDPGMDPSMMSEMPPMDQGGMMPPPPPPPASAPMTNQVANNGLGATKQSSYSHSAYLFDLAEQSSTEKTAALNGQMEKDAMSIPQGAANILVGAGSQGIKDALKGALTGGAVGLGSSFLRDYGTDDFTPWKDALVGSLIGTGVGGSMGGLLGAGEAALLNREIIKGLGVSA